MEGDKGMKLTIYMIGLLIVTAILYAIPILTACSIIYEWDGFLRILLIMASIIEFCGLYILIDDKISREEGEK